MTMTMVLVGMLAQTLDEIALQGDDTVITQSVRVKPGTYRIPDAKADGIVRIKGEDLTIDFQGAVLIGATEDAKPDQFRGFGVIADECRNLTVKNLVVRGMKVGMYFKRCDGLTVTGCDVSGNFRQHLKSTPRAEDQGDWLWAYENDNNEWFRYGAGIYVENSKNVTLSRNRGRNGQNGICFSKVNDSWVIDNDMSFMSGWGLAMWRSCRNDVSNNKFDWCIRGFSYKTYHRGQDSAGILLYEQCHDNVFAYNSATHGGDGFFLYAGNETLERTGVGGCNRNVLYRNDFSHAAANGIEATFSDGNVFAENIMEECEHGVWAGYSYNTVIVGNVIRNCPNGISIEHGHDTLIEGNTFENDSVGVHVWWSPSERVKGRPYEKKQDTTSHGYTLARNTFKGGRAAIWLGATSDVRITENVIDSPLALRIQGKSEKIQVDVFDGKVDGPQPERVKLAVPKHELRVPATKGTQEALLPKGAPRGWRFIFVDEWGPYDFSGVRLHPNEVLAWGSAELQMLGPDVEFKVQDVMGGVTVEPLSGRLPAKLKVTMDGQAMRSFSFTVRAGEETVKATGVLMRSSWEVKFFNWGDQGPKQAPADWAALVAGKPVATRMLERLDNPWSGEDRVPGDFFATLATTRMDLPAGQYEIGTNSDDGVRVYVDDKRVIDNWDWHMPEDDKALVALEAGEHRFRVEHFEIDGHQQLRFWIRPVK
ncbi:MAG: right-handed parallel beta-helix repeat-containing protein [Planctomycetes bacterium]|nr:right-handed parallel beta-helix repeat-containing protein [Planctomycetota bacterium]